MSHLIDSFAFTGKPAWHGLGNELTAGASIDQWIVEAGLNWYIEESMVRFNTPSDNGIKSVPDMKVYYRSDTLESIGVVGASHKAVQPAETLEFFRDLVKPGGMQIETAGSLKGGRIIFALATNPANDFSIGGKDKVKPYWLIVTANDGSMRTHVYKTTIRVVCNNTLQMSFGDRRDGVSVSHRSTFNASAVKRELGLYAGEIDAFHNQVDTWAMRGITDKVAVNYFAELYAKRDEKGNLTNEKGLERIVNDVMGVFKHGPGADLPTARGTQWGVLNAVTRYVDFETRARSNENRFHSSQFGPGAKMKARAVDMLGAVEYETIAPPVPLGGQGDSDNDFHRLVGL